MRILVISNLYPPAVLGGYEVLCAETVNRLADRHEITVLTSDHGGVGSEPGIVRELAYLPEGDRRATLEAPLAARRAVRVTQRVLDDFRPDLVFVWNGASMPQAAIRTAELSGAAVAYSVCEYWFGGLYAHDRFMRYLRPGWSGSRGAWAQAMRAFDRLPGLRLDTGTRVRASICWVSDFLRRAVPVPATVDPLEQRVIYTGVHDPELWSSVERKPAAEQPLIAYVGRLEAQKGPDVAYRALAALRDQHGLEARLVLAGKQQPEMTAQLAALARELGLESSVEPIGQVSQSEVAQLMAKAWAIVVPSVWEEPSGGIALEAGLARVPVVASRSGGMPEGLLEEEHALYFPIGDHDACAAQLARVLRDPAGAEARAARAFQRVQSFTFDRYMEQMDEFVQAAAMPRPPRPALRQSPA